MVLRLKAWESKSSPNLTSNMETYLSYDEPQIDKLEASVAGWSSPRALQTLHWRVCLTRTPRQAHNLTKELHTVSRDGAARPRGLRGPTGATVHTDLVRLTTWQHQCRGMEQPGSSSGS